MIVGVGIDLVEVHRMQALQARFGERLVARLLAPTEADEYRRSGNPARFMARRFAAKEAAGKALGTGVGDGVRFRDLVTEHDPAGAPQLRLLGRAREHANRLGVVHAHMSVSDERAAVVAMVVLEAGS